MRGAVRPFPHYASMALCLVKAQGQLYNTLTFMLFLESLLLLLFCYRLSPETFGYALVFLKPFTNLTNGQY